jgi:Uma2 family endonuclease
MGAPGSQRIGYTLSDLIEPHSCEKMKTISIQNPQTVFTLEEYFALECASERRFEYWDGEVVCMSGGSPEHNQITSNLTFILRRGLVDRSCRVFVSDMRVKTPALPPYRYPDLVALCDRPEYELIDGVNTLLDPTLIIEVLSPSTEHLDRRDKFLVYRSIPTFAEYLLVAQDRSHITQRTKQVDGTWSERISSALDEAVHLISVGCDLPLLEVYEAVEFGPRDAGTTI